MSKKNYILTITKYGYKVEAWDKYGKYISVSTKTRQEASDFIISWWDKSEENKANSERTHKAMLNMIEIDKKCGIVSGNRDSLD